MLAGTVRPLNGQEGVRQQASRADLLKVESSLATNAADPRLITVRARLTNGDFRDGDRIELRVVGEPTLTESFTVRAGSLLVLPDLPPISLVGVLRSELEPHLRTEIGKTIRGAQVTATSLVRVAVLGGVVRPGFYQMPAETPIAQAIMLAGGPSANVKLERTVVRRGTAEVIRADSVRTLLSSGASLDQASLQPGDEIVLPQARTGGAGLLPVLTTVGGIIATVAFLVVR